MFQTLGIYVHVPFCLSKCHYCAFISQAGSEDLYKPYVAALCNEIAAAGGDFGLTAMQVDTIFFGGGTPTVLTADDLGKILQAIQNNFCLSVDAEISLEANPGTIDKEKMVRLRSIGFNRLSIGVQSFDDEVLSAAGRIHCADEAISTVMSAQKAGFDNLSLDLMYGLPGQSVASWEKTLSKAVQLAPNHISAYGLKVEEKTSLAAALNDGRITLPTEYEEETMYDMLNEILPQQGYRRYEISNYAQPGCQCRHNLKYWRYLPYRGVGAAAHSFYPYERFSNVEDVCEYLRRLQFGLAPEVFREKLDLPTSMGEYIFLALRTIEGVDTVAFDRLFKQDFFRYFSFQVENLLKQGLIQREGEFLRLTPRGMKFGNQVFAEFLP